MNYFLREGHLVHPDIWILWASAIFTALNTLAVIALFWRLFRGPDHQ